MSGRRQVMSLEAAMEEERKEIESLLSAGNMPKNPPSRNSARSPSPLNSPRSDGPSRSGYRSMLDLDNPPAPVRSMLDIGGAPTSASRLPGSASAQTSPVLKSRTPVARQPVHYRSVSDAASQPVEFGPRAAALPSRSRNPTEDYRFSDFIATNVGQAQPGSKRTQQSQRSSSIGEALRGADLSSLVFPGEKSRGFGLRSNSKSKSPNRYSARSGSPGASLVGNRQRPEALKNSIVLDNGSTMDKSTAFRRLSDANLVYGGSSLGTYVRQKPTNANGRLERDNMSPYGDILPSDDSSDDAHSSDEEDHRGRKLTKRAGSRDSSTDPSKTAKSLLAAAEDERKHIVGQPQYRSLFDPEVTVTSPTGTKQNKGKQAIQPTTSFDQEPPSGTGTPNDPERESDVSAIQQAQKLELSSTPIILNSDVHRSLKIIYRGEFHKIQQDAAEDHRRLRKYVVATDLSDESTHALEWAIGTVLRDGDTLIAIYCMDEEASGAIDPGNQVPDDPKSMREQAAALNAMARNTRSPPTPGSPNPLYLQRPSLSPRGSATPSPAPSFRGRSKLEEERERAVQDITDRVSKLLRKTQLQVRVIVECIHCKNPKHLITEVIDFVSPTLVILGSRGRSALKGTLLGSFSNYLVTKSSTPVMVARKRLRKKSKYQAPPSRQVNNLSNPLNRGLESARVD